jgi:hypothetical protein
MGENPTDGSGTLTAVERGLHRALTAMSATLSGAATVPEPAGSLRVRTLSWNAICLNAERVLPAATVTWAGHGPVAARTTTTAADPCATVADLSRLPVGGGLVDALAGIEVADLGDGELLDVGARWQEVVSWAVAMQSRALGEIGRRRGWTEEHGAVAAEVSARLRVPQGEANKHLARGAGLAEHPPVMDALQAGLIDTVKADILLRSGNPLTTQERAAAIRLYLPQAPDHTRRWLREKMNEFATDLHGTTEVTKHARSRRGVFLDPADNAMAWISANLPATDAAAVWDAVEQAAHALRRAPGGTRGLTLVLGHADSSICWGSEMIENYGQEELLRGVPSAGRRLV